MSKHTITFVFDHAIVSTDISGETDVVTQASLKLQTEMGISTDEAIQVIIHDHDTQNGSEYGLI